MGLLRGCFGTVASHAGQCRAVRWLCQVELVWQRAQHTAHTGSKSRQRQLSTCLVPGQAAQWRHWHSCNVEISYSLRLQSPILGMEGDNLSKKKGYHKPQGCVHWLLRADLQI